MAGKLVVLCSLQRVPVLDRTTGGKDFQGFALNLTVGWDGPDLPTGTTANRLFNPWLWPRLVAAKAFWKKTDGTTTTPRQATFIGTSGVPDRPPAAFATALERMYGEISRVNNNLILNPQPASGTDREALRYQLDASRELRPWHALLNHVSTYPFPLPQSCNIAHLFVMEKEADTESLIAAPVFVKAAGTNFPEQAYEPDGPTVAIGNNAVEWAYTPNTPVEIIARLQPAQVAVEGDNFINLDQLWVTPPTGSGPTNFTTDWQATMETRVAEPFQLAQFMLEFMRDDKSPVVLAVDTNLEKCISLTLAALRDVVGIGTSPAPDGIRVAKRLFELFPDIIKPNELDVLDKPAAGPSWNNLDSFSFNLLSEWRKFLRDHVPEASTLSILQDAPRPEDSLRRVSLQQAVAELEWLIATVLDTRSQGDRPTQQNQQPTLWKLYAEQWKRVLTAAPLDAGLETKLGAVLNELQVPDRSRLLDLRQQLRLSNLGKFWLDFIRSQRSTADDPLGHKLLDECLPAFLKFYAKVRLGLDFDLTGVPCTLPTSNPAFFPAVPADAVPAGDLLTALKTKFESWIGTFNASLKPEVTPVAADTALANTPHAITVQAARVQRDPSETAGEVDPLEQISGIGALMRETGTTTWRPLNLASARIDETELFPGKSVLVPSRLHYRSDVRQACISYNNHPLAARSPLADPTMTSAVFEPTPGVPMPPTIATDELVRYAAFATAVMPGLKFGAKYDFALFAILNSGVLPRELSTLDQPCSLKPTFDSLPATAIIKDIPYPRFVKIGALRSLNCELVPGTQQCQPLAGSQRYSPLKLPPVPDNVSPRARDIPALNLGEGVADTREKSALMLLAPADWGGEKLRKFTFGMRLPATSWECWDRWVAGVATVTKLERQNVLADFARKTADNKRSREAGSEVDVLLDDPAVEKRLFVILQREKDGVLIPITGKFVPVTRKGTTPLQSFQSLPVPFSCEHTTSDEELQVNLETDPTRSSQVLVKVKQGEVYQLTICACISTVNAAKFGAGAISTFSPPADISSDGLSLLSPSHFVIEAATAALPTSTEVYQATTTKFFEDRSQWKLRARVEGPPASTTFRNVHRAEIDRQVWRWQGRVTERHPELKEDFTATQVKSTLVNDYRDKILKWEAVEFGERQNADHITHDMKSELSGAAGLRTFLFEELLGKENDEPKSAELRGLHFRLAVRLFSRYEGIMPDDVRKSVQGEQNLGQRLSDKVEVVTPWHSQFVPCRRQPPFESPKIKFVLPLTERIRPDETGSPGVLIVLDERWHEAGGLGEELEAEVALSEDPNPRDNVETFYYELGPDPIITRTGLLPPVKTGTKAPTQVTIDSLQGPVGHFFDRENSTALFVSSSFLLPAPKVTPALPNKLGWYFAKIRLRRVINTRLPANSVAAHSEYLPTPDWKRGRLVSEFTEPIWVQFLPEFSIFDGFDEVVDKLRLVVTFPGSAGMPYLELFDSNARRVTLQEFKSDQNIFSLYVVLTARVFDVTGRTDQEAFVGLFSRHSSGVWNTADTEVKKWQPQAGQNPQFIARVIEVQESSSKPKGDCLINPSTTDDFWARLFGKTDNSQKNCDTNARIVRISRPIESNLTPRCQD